MKVLSLFDGMSCGHQALERAGIDVDTYYASEIDKYAIKVTMANYPDTIQLGSVVDINALELPKIDLLLGGSPCQSFSFAGKRKGMSTKDEQEILTLDHYLKLKSEGYEFEGQSYLFWEYMRILEELRVKNPNVLFLLENVEMGAKWEKVLSNAIGVRGIHINSSLVSAQNRKRIYWINWGMKPSGLFGDMESIIEQPKDRKILLKDILESKVDEKYFLSEKFDNWLNKHSLKTGNEYKKTEGNRKAGCLSVSALKSVNLSADFILDSNEQIIVHNTQRRDPNRPSIQKNKNAGGSGHLSRNDGKTYCLDGANTNAVEIVANGAKEQVVGRKAQEDGTYKREYEVSNDEKAKTLETNKQKNNVVIKEIKQLNPSTESGGKQPYQQNRIYDVNGISPALMQGKSDLIIKEEYFEVNYKQNKEKLILAGNLKGGKWDNTHETSGRVYDSNGKSPTIPTMQGGNQHPKTLLNSRIRRLTPIECERLQTVNPEYTKKGLENHFQLFNFTGNKFTLCQRFVKKKIVTNQFQVEKLNYAINTIIDLLETEQPNCQDQLLTALKNVSWNVVNENNNHLQKRVLCTIKDGKDMGHLLFPKELINQNLNVSFVIRKLEGQEALECVTNISKCSDYTETLYTQKKKDLNQIHTDIIEIPMESNFTEKLLNKKLVENLLRESKSYIILTLIKLIITQAIYKSLQNQNTPVHINSLIKLQDNSLELELLYIETENIVSISDSMRYKMLGNGWTIEVISYLFKHI
jgi:DNA (cytosine-5)-methyltransferase 3A